MPNDDLKRAIRGAADRSLLVLNTQEADALAAAVAEALPHLVDLVRHGYGHIQLNIFKHEYDSCELATRHKRSKAT